MFNWIPFDSFLFWIWLAGFLLLSPVVFFAWMFNSAFLGDSTDKWYQTYMFVWFTFLGFVMTWLWPIGLPGFLAFEANSKRKSRKWDKVYKYKKATVPHYWEEAYIRNSKVLNGAKVRILDWEIQPGMTRVSSWDGKLITRSRFLKHIKQAVLLWPTADLELIPEKVKKT